MLVAVQLSVPGLYLPPVLKGDDLHPKQSFHCRSTLPCDPFGQRALLVLVAIQLSVLGLYLPPVLKKSRVIPPQTIISLPVQTAVCLSRAEGALVCW